MEMAQQQAPPAALAPIAVVVDEVQINSDAMLVLAPGAQHVRDHTSFLNWATVYNGAAAVASYTLGQSDAKGAFLPRCQFSGDQQTGTLLDGNHVLNVFFNGAFWSRLLTALDAANLFATWRHSNSIVSGGTQTPSCLEALKLRRVWRHSNSTIVSGGTIVTRRSGGGYTARQRVNHIGSSRHRIADARGTVVAGVGRSRHRTADARGTAQQQATEGGSRHRAADA